MVISSHEVSPQATETVTTVSVEAEESEEDASVVEEPSVDVVVSVVVVVVCVDEESVEPVSLEDESVEVVLTGTVVFDSCEVVDLLLTHERIEKTRMSVSASASAQITSSVVRRSCPPWPRELPGILPRCPSERRRTFGLSTLAMFLDERLPEMVDARS